MMDLCAISNGTQTRYVIYIPLDEPKGLLQFHLLPPVKRIDDYHQRSNDVILLKCEGFHIQDPEKED